MLMWIILTRKRELFLSFSISDSILVLPEISEEELQTIYNGAWVNNDLSDKDSYPQKFVLDNMALMEKM